MSLPYKYEYIGQQQQEEEIEPITWHRNHRPFEIQQEAFGGA